VAAVREAGVLPYLAKIEKAAALVRTLGDWRPVTVAAITDARSDGRAAVGLRFWSLFIAGLTGLAPGDIIDAVSDAAAGAGLPIEVGLVGTVMRDDGPGSGRDRRLSSHTRSRSGLAGLS
jgi:adenosine deaminase